MDNQNKNPQSSDRNASGLNLANFRGVIPQALGKISYGLYVVSAADGDKINGQIVNTVFQVTSSPSRVAVGVNKANLTHEYISKSKKFSVTVLSADTPQVFIGTFGFRTGRNFNKFEKTEYKNVNGVPVVTENAISIMTFDVDGSVDMGTHTLFYGTVTYAENIKEGNVLTYEYYKNVIKGKTHKNATTYVAEK